MILPEISQLRNTQSTYITFNKALLDYDKAIANNEKWYFTKVVALNLPNWQNPDFFIDLTAQGVISTNPNLVIPKSIQYYMENICRQNIGVNNAEVEEIAEIAFWKMLSKMGLTEQQRKNCFTFVNEIAIGNFTKLDNNNGWGEIIAQIPNKCKLLVPAWKSLASIRSTVQCDNEDVCLFDNGNKQFIFDSTQKTVIDFSNVTYNTQTVGSFNFNCLMLYYTDETGIQKLHGINFIYPFENKITYWDLKQFNQKTNEIQTIGYQFKFNMKTVNNDASQVVIYELQEHSHYNTFFETLTKLNSFLEEKIHPMV